MEAEENNPMKALENRTVDSKREMDILDALQDIRARNARNERVGQSVDLLDQLGIEEIETEEDARKREQDEEDEKLVREVFSKVSMPASSSGSGAAAATQVVDGEPEASSSSVVTVKRKAEGMEPDLYSLLPESTRALITSKAAEMPVAKKKKTDMKNTLGIKIRKGKAAVKV